MGAMTIMVPAPRLLAEGFTMVESARWHEGRLWFAHWGSGEVVAVDMDGRSEVVAAGRTGMGWAIDWLPDGRLLVSGEELTRIEPDGSAVRHSSQGGNELVVDPAGRVYLDGADFDFLWGGAPEPGWIRLIDAEGTAHDVAGDIDFPNGMVITADGSRLVIAESFAGRLSAFDIASDGHCLTGASGQTGWDRTASASIRAVASGLRPPTRSPIRRIRALRRERWSGCSRAVRSPTESRRPCPASPAGSAGRRVDTCSCCATSSKASTNSRRCSPAAARGSMSPKCRSSDPPARARIRFGYRASPTGPGA